jgi:hypothetical protein
MELLDIEQAAKKFSKRREELASEVESLNAAIDALKRQAIPRIKRLVAAAAESQEDLHYLIDTNQVLFVKPKTQVFWGVRVGLRTATGMLDWDDDSAVVDLIRRQFPKSQADLLIKTTEKPIAGALADLEPETLAKIGVRVSRCGEQVFIKPVDGEVDKVVNALLRGAMEGEGA